MSASRSLPSRKHSPPVKVTRSIEGIRFASPISECILSTGIAPAARGPEPMQQWSHAAVQRRTVISERTRGRASMGALPRNVHVSSQRDVVGHQAVERTPLNIGAAIGYRRYQV